MYGTRDAAQNWEEEYTSFLVGIGCRKGRASPCVFFHKERNIRVVVHGDDFTFSGMDADLTWIENLMKSWFEVKARARLGPEPDDDKEIVVLGRVVTWKDECIEYQADPKRRSIVREQFGFEEGSKGLSVSGKAEDQDDDDEELEGPEATEFKAMAARLNFMALDCPDVQFATKEICREMSSPNRSSWTRIKRLARYLLDRVRTVYKYEWLYEDPEMDLYTDSDWAGCRRTRKSTTGGAAMRGPHCLKTWSVTQGPVSDTPLRSHETTANL